MADRPNLSYQHLCALGLGFRYRDLLWNLVRGGRITLGREGSRVHPSISHDPGRRGSGDR